MKRVLAQSQVVKIQLINGPRAARQQTAIFQLPTTMIIRKTHSPAMIQARLDHPEYFLNQYNLHSINQHGHNLFLLYHFHHNQHCLYTTFTTHTALARIAPVCVVLINTLKPGGARPGQVQRGRVKRRSVPVPRTC